MSFFKKITSIGPGILVTSAFIGPGTVTVCTIAGYQFGYDLLWALLFSVIATIILQQMCSRLGIITQSGLGEALKKGIENKFVRLIALSLTFGAIVIGNGAYEAGNISGASLGLQTIFIGIPAYWLTTAIGLIAILIVFSGSYKFVERMMIFLVLTMSIVFIVTAVYVLPNFSSLVKGALIPSLPEGSTMLVVGLIGTTVVPYNLFLHASSSATKWKSPKDLPDANFDTSFSIILGGLISMAIVITAASATVSTAIAGAADLAIQLEPLLGAWSKYFIAAGLFAAGISSSITAPLAAAFAAAGIFSFPPDFRNKSFRLVAGVILITGIIFSLAGFKPIEIIQFAQVANGALLPFLAIFLMIIMNKKSILGEHSNSTLQNIGGIMVILVTLLLGIKSILTATGV